MTRKSLMCILAEVLSFAVLAGVENVDPTVRKIETDRGVAYVFTRTDGLIKFSFDTDVKLCRPVGHDGDGYGRRRHGLVHQVK